MNIVLLVRSLGMGGAERQLVLLARELASRHTVTVMIFYDTDDYFDASSIGRARLVRLNKRGRWDMVSFLQRYLAAVRKAQPDVVYAFMGPASLMALTSRFGHARVRVAWGLRSSNIDLSQYGWFARIVRRAEAGLSRSADLIIANSDAGVRQAEADGFATRRMIMIGNGINTEVFQHRPGVRAEVRRELGVPSQARLVGMVARIDPMKGYEILLQAAALVSRGRPDVHFVLAGGGSAQDLARLQAMAASLGITAIVHWLGRVDDVTRVYCALDVATSASSSEGFSNAIGEAMACGLPCVVTDVGDSSRIVADTGVVVPPGSAEQLAAGLLRLLGLPDAERSALGARAAEHIRTHHSVCRMVNTTEAALLRLVS